MLQLTRMCLPQHQKVMLLGVLCCFGAIRFILVEVTKVGFHIQTMALKTSVRSLMQTELPCVDKLQINNNQYNIKIISRKVDEYY